MEKRIRIAGSGHIIRFYQKENDEKYSFEIEGNPELTEKLLSSVKTKRVKEKDIRYAVQGITEKIIEILNGDFDQYEKTVENIPSALPKSPTVELNELCQKIFRENMETEMVDKYGPDHCPTIVVEVRLPNGYSCTEKANSQKEARRLAAEKALKWLKDNYN